MKRLPLIAATLALVAAACPASARQRSDYATGRLLFATAFDPELNFAGELEPSTEDELLLTAAASVRDDHVPAYSLAVAYDCYGSPGGCRYLARILRVGPGPIADQSDKGFALLYRGRLAGSAARLRAVMDGSKLQWLEADLGRCEGAIGAMDAIRAADWRPDVHYALLDVEDRQILHHPAQIRVRMTGSDITSRYQGWVLAPGVPAAVANFLAMVEPCWAPSRSPPPWRRTAARKRPG